jgi:hypothetical protein
LLCFVLPCIVAFFCKCLLENRLANLFSFIVARWWNQFMWHSTVYPRIVCAFTSCLFCSRHALLTCSLHQLLQAPFQLHSSMFSSCPALRSTQQRAKAITTYIFQTLSALSHTIGVRNIAVGWGTMLRAGGSRVTFHEVTGLFQFT